MLKTFLVLLLSVFLFALFFFEQENSNETDNNKISKILNILDKISFYQNIRLLQFS